MDKLLKAQRSRREKPAQGGASSTRTPKMDRNL
jgi:hypothetical protein